MADSGSFVITASVFGNEWLFLPNAAIPIVWVKFHSYELTCPFHKKSRTTACKKWSPLLGASEQERRHALSRLYTWALRAHEVTRQRDHVPMQLCASPDEFTPWTELEGLIHNTVAPSTRVATDEELDAEEGVEPPTKKRAVGKRLLRPT